MKSKWSQYVSERFPVSTYAILSSLFAFSSYLLNLDKNTVSFSSENIPFVLSAFSIIFIFFFGLRLMDERKDYQKDLLAHPNRPLPRGLITTQEVDQLLVLYWITALAIVLFLFIFKFMIGAMVCGIIFGFQYLMFKEFWIGEWLNERPLFVALSHQVVVLPLAALGGSLYVQSFSAVSPLVVVYSFLSLGAFFTYEVGRKMDPFAHPILKTYRAVYGWLGSFLMALGALALSVYFGIVLLGTWLLPMQILTLTIFIFSYFRPAKFKWVERVVTVNLVAHLMAGIFYYFVRGSLI